MGIIFTGENAKWLESQDMGRDFPSKPLSITLTKLQTDWINNHFIWSMDSLLTTQFEIK